MDILCNTICFFHPKYYNKEFLMISGRFKNDVQVLIESKKSDEEIKFLGYLLRFFKILENDSGLRSNLIQFRNEVEMYKSNNNNNKAREWIIELTIQTITLVHYGTLYCTSRAKFEIRASNLKKEYHLFKDWIKANKTNVDLSSLEKFYVSYLYKIPKLMKIKRGFKKIDKNRSSLNGQE